MIHLLRRPSARLACNLRSIRADSTRSSPKPPIRLPYSKHQPSSKPAPVGASAADVAPARFRWLHVGKWRWAQIRKWRWPQGSKWRLPEVSIWRWLLWMLNLFIAGHLVTKYLFDIKPCYGPSMLPTLNFTGDWVFISKVHAKMDWIRVGDLVSYHNPARRGYYGIKRVIAMPGDFVLRDTPGKGEGYMVRVPPSHCWVVGDNMDWSRDSRDFGALPLALVRGKIVARVWPHPTLFRNPFPDPVDLEDDLDLFQVYTY